MYLRCFSARPRSADPLTVVTAVKTEVTAKHAQQRSELALVFFSARPHCAGPLTVVTSVMTEVGAKHAQQRSVLALVFFSPVTISLLKTKLLKWVHFKKNHTYDHFKFISF